MSMNTVSLYMGQGAKVRAKLVAARGEDPIFKLWVWKPVTVHGYAYPTDDFC